MYIHTYMHLIMVRIAIYMTDVAFIVFCKGKPTKATLKL